MRDTGADFLAFETVPLFEEARAILEALARSPEIAAYISFTCRDESHTGHGEPIEDCARLLRSHPQILAIGINCTAPSHVLPLDPQHPGRQHNAHRRLPQLRRDLDGGDAELERQLRPSRVRRHGTPVARGRSGLDWRLLPHRARDTSAPSPRWRTPDKFPQPRLENPTTPDNAVSLSLDNGKRNLPEGERNQHDNQENRQRVSRLAAR